MLHPTSPASFVDERGRPYFLWDCELTLDEFRTRLYDADPAVRAYFLGKLMRQAKPDDVFQFVTLEEIRGLWPRVTAFLGTTLPFWTWLLDAWSRSADDRR